jgi:hypothetical protein
MKFTPLLFVTLTLNVLARGDGLDGKVMCGYQGWFRVPEDGSDNGWHHYAPGRLFEPGKCNIDLWPDVRELPAADRFPTPFRHPDGSVAEVFSSVRPATVALHFKWMREYGIDGVFLQRFIVQTREERWRQPLDRILDACRQSARETGRSWALMYDLSGQRSNAAAAVIADWKRLDGQFHLTDAAQNPAYLRHRGKPLVSLWGLGFNDRPPMRDDWREMIRFFKTDAGCALMLGVPAYWRTLDRDTIADPELHKLVAEADVVSPWNVGRYDSPEAAARHAANTTRPDLAWCRERKLDYLPVAFPGFSWHNLSAARGREQKVDAIPRRGGEFFWSQCREFHKAGATMLYGAMFDELDEGTAIFKVRQDPPVGASPFVSEPGVPNDHYLWLTGMAGKLLRNEIEDGLAMPARSEPR